MIITKILPRQILDSRGNPTVEVDVILEDGSFGRADVPSGASTGSREAIELRDGDNTVYAGLGVQDAIANINNVIIPAVISRDFEQAELDSTLCKLDGTENKSKIGANAILAVSLAYAKACANAKNQALFEHIREISGTNPSKLPVPMFNIINGGKHAKNSADIQEFMILPSGIESISKQIQAGAEIFHCLGKILNTLGFATSVGDEGGFTLPQKHTNTDALDLIVHAIKEANYEPGKDIFIALDVAASELYINGTYNFTAEGNEFNSNDLIEFYKKLIQSYPIVSIEDGLDEDDWQGWTKLNESLGDSTMIVGDDLLVTNTTYIQKAIDQKACNAVLIKPNQIGTLTETIEAVQLAHENGFNTVMSHRSGETEDTTIAHLAVGLGCKFIKSGSLSRSERLAKYNELLRITELI